VVVSQPAGMKVTTLSGAFKANPTVAFFSVFGIILSAGYALWLYARVIYGKLDKPNLQGILDLDTREKIIIAPLVALTIWYGVHPAPVLDTFAPSTEALVQNMRGALANTQTAEAAAKAAKSAAAEKTAALESQKTVEAAAR
jgi:NADH-quinone oxidoreductase subunit M